MAELPKIPVQHFVAVSTPKANTVLFQVNDKSQLTLYESAIPDETKRIPYTFKTIRVNGDKIEVNHRHNIIAAVSFSHKNCCQGQEQIRVYYVARDDNYLRELCRSGGPDAKWTHGEDFNDKNYEIVEKSGLTANVFQIDQSSDKFAIKIYYQRSNKDDYADVIYNIVGSDDWSTRVNVTDA